MDVDTFMHLAISNGMLWAIQVNTIEENPIKMDRNDKCWLI